MSSRKQKYELFVGLLAIAFNVAVIEKRDITLMITRKQFFSKNEKKNTTYLFVYQEKKIGLKE